MTLANWVTALSTLILVGITGYYAWQTHRMVEEMTASRLGQLRPILVPRITIHPLFPHLGRYGVENVGPAVGLGIDVTLRFEPGDMRWTLQTMALAPRESRPFMTEGRIPDYDLRKHGETWNAVHLVGHCLDVSGLRHEIDIRVPLRELSEIPIAAIIAGAVQPPPSVSP